MRAGHEIAAKPASAVRGSLRVPGDKSISHRYALLAAIAEGPSTIANYAPGADCQSTLACLRALGLGIRTSADRSQVTIEGRGRHGLRAPAVSLDCGNSGSTMRMLAGVVAAHRFQSVLVGDASLSRRPMRRIVEPLSRMGARIETAGSHGGPPLIVTGTDLGGISFRPATPSAQVKSAVLLAGLQADGVTEVIEEASTRDHTERALPAFGASVEVRGAVKSVRGGQSLTGANLTVPGDLSSAAFPLAAAAALPESEVRVEDVGLNPTRIGFLELLRRWGADVAIDVQQVRHGEPMGSVSVRHRPLGRLEVGASEVPAVIDELPVLAALAACSGELRVTGASELRVKESDRIGALVSGLRAAGADADELPDGFHVRASRRLSGGTVQAMGDHRLAMAFAVAGLGASAPIVIDGADAVAVSYPSFFDDLDRLRV
jgi:3-phosphoshikimate 1-carboxyvinyltransferase